MKDTSLINKFSLLWSFVGLVALFENDPEKQPSDYYNGEYVIVDESVENFYAVALTPHRLDLLEVKCFSKKNAKYRITRVTDEPQRITNYLSTLVKYSKTRKDKQGQREFEDSCYQRVSRVAESVQRSVVTRDTINLRFVSLVLASFRF